MESNFGVEKDCLCFAHKIVYSNLWSGVLEWSIGVRFWSCKSRMECSCDVCVCVAKFSVIL